MNLSNVKNTPEKHTNQQISCKDKHLEFITSLVSFGCGLLIHLKFNHLNSGPI